MHHRYLLIASLTLCVAACSPGPSKRPTLDTELAQPCAQLPGKPEDDYDAWLDWMIKTSERYGVCRKRHKELVELWER